ncbi:hypothetical protein K466DRAFT_395752 [Polyporus arcularius HHB13444]|uniref:Uncharacterized protein n=1 Tax=Polyporus arcularius HHB13444 TaxID=1314778 RepID=A0A5C3NSS6_9APHY|nr:hypothetical protein K466DRAFT_395752 [Polyporus arcularius HHB13444]
MVRFRVRPAPRGRPPAPNHASSRNPPSPRSRRETPPRMRADCQRALYLCLLTRTAALLSWQPHPALSFSLRTLPRLAPTTAGPEEPPLSTSHRIMSRLAACTRIVSSALDCGLCRSANLPRLPRSQCKMDTTADSDTVACGILASSACEDLGGV